MSDRMEARLYLRAQDFWKLSQDSRDYLLSSGYIDMHDIEAANPSDVLEFIADDCKEGMFGEIENELVAMKIPFDRWSDSAGGFNSSKRIRFYRPGKNGRPAIDETHDEAEFKICPHKLEEAIVGLPDGPVKNRLTQMIAVATLAHIPAL